MKAKLLAAWNWVKAEFIRLEVWAKSVVMAAIAGGLNVVYEMYHSGIAFTATAEHYTMLKAKFISGAVTGVVAYWVKTPWTGNQPKQ